MAKFDSTGCTVYCKQFSFEFVFPTKISIMIMTRTNVANLLLNLCLDKTVILHKTVDYSATSTAVLNLPKADRKRESGFPAAPKEASL